MTSSVISLAKFSIAAAGVERDFVFLVIDRSAKIDGTVSTQCGLAVMQSV